MVRRLRCPSAAVLGCGVDERPLQVGEDPNQQGQYEEDSQRDLRELVDVIHANSLIGVSLSSFDGTDWVLRSLFSKLGGRAVTGRIWLDVIVSLAAAVLLSWLALVIALAIRRPKGNLMKESLRLLPDLLRLLRRLTTNRDLPTGSASESPCCSSTWLCRSI